MSIISEFVSVLGADNVNTIVALILAGLTGKTSWDFYKSKEVVKHYELKKQEESLVSNIEEIKKSLIELQQSIDSTKLEVESSRGKVDKMEDRLLNKIKNLEEKAKLTDERLVGLLDGVVVAPKISRAEARRLKEGKDS